MATEYPDYGFHNAPTTVPESLVDSIIRIESGGNPNAKNPRSSASGLGQFINSTWRSMISTFRPDLAVGRTQAEINALKNDPQIARAMVGHYSRQNASFLQNRGVPVNPGSLYLAHFLGPGTAAKVLKEQPTADLSTILPSSVFKANPFLKGMTVNDVSTWASGKMSGNVSRQQNLKTLQRDLAAKGFDPGPIDGIMGPQTQRALDAAREAQTQAGRMGRPIQQNRASAVPSSFSLPSMSPLASITRGTNAKLGGGALAQGGPLGVASAVPDDRATRQPTPNIRGAPAQSLGDILSGANTGRPAVQAPFVDARQRAVEAAQRMTAIKPTPVSTTLISATPKTPTVGPSIGQFTRAAPLMTGTGANTGRPVARQPAAKPASGGSLLATLDNAAKQAGKFINDPVGTTTRAVAPAIAAAAAKAGAKYAAQNPAATYNAGLSAPASAFGKTGKEVGKALNTFMPAYVNAASYGGQAGQSRAGAATRDPVQTAINIRNLTGDTRKGWDTLNVFRPTQSQITQYSKAVWQPIDRPKMYDVSSWVPPSVPKMVEMALGPSGALLGAAKNALGATTGARSLATVAPTLNPDRTKDDDIRAVPSAAMTAPLPRARPAYTPPAVPPPAIAAPVVQVPTVQAPTMTPSGPKTAPKPNMLGNLLSNVGRFAKGPGLMDQAKATGMQGGPKAFWNAVNTSGMGPTDIARASYMAAQLYGPQALAAPIAMQRAQQVASGGSRSGNYGGTSGSRSYSSGSRYSGPGSGGYTNRSGGA